LVIVRCGLAMGQMPRFTERISSCQKFSGNEGQTRKHIIAITKNCRKWTTRIQEGIKDTVSDRNDGYPSSFHVH